MSNITVAAIALPERAIPPEEIVLITLGSIFNSSLKIVPCGCIFHKSLKANKVVVIEEDGKKLKSIDSKD